MQEEDFFDFDDLEPLKSTPRERINLNLSNKNTRQIKTNTIQSGNFFFDQPIKDNKVFYFSNCFQTKEEVLKYINDELKIREYHLSTLSSNAIQGYALKRLEKEIDILKQLFIGLLIEKLNLQVINSQHYKFILQLQQQETSKQVVNEFVFMLDFVDDLPYTAEKIRIKYGYFRKGFKHEANRTSNEHFVEAEGGKSFIKEIETVIFPDKKSDHFIYFQILVFHAKQILPESIGWSAHKIHNKKNFIEFGQFQIPFYDHRLPMESLINDYQKSVGPINLCFSILPYDLEKEETPYRMPEYYKLDNYQIPELHQEDRLSINLKRQIKKEIKLKENLEQQRQKQLYESTFKEEAYPLLTGFEAEDKFQSNPNSSSNISLNGINKKEVDQYVRMSIDYNLNPNELLQQLALFNQSLNQNKNENYTIMEENNEDYTEMI